MKSLSEGAKAGRLPMNVRGSVSVLIPCLGSSDFLASSRSSKEQYLIRFFLSNF